MPCKKEVIFSTIMNLRCPSLTYYRWYNETFLSTIYQRNDSLFDFWKEQFLFVLPPHFAKKIHNCLSSQYNGIKPYILFTFLNSLLKLLLKHYPYVKI